MDEQSKQQWRKGEPKMFRIWGRKSKKKLREENAMLKAEIDHLRRINDFIIREKREIIKVDSSISIPLSEKACIPEEAIRQATAEGMVNYLIPYIEYSCSENLHTGEIIVRACLYIAVKEEKEETR